jgi:hypothetical protein
MKKRIDNPEGKKMKRFTLFVLVMCIISGCATSPMEASKVDCGPFPENYKEMIQCYLNFKLDNPSNYKDFAIIKPPEKVIADTFYTTIPMVEGDEAWECFIVYDAKNSQSHYIGKDLHVVWIRDLKIVAFDFTGIEVEFRVKQRQGDPCKTSG